MFASQKGKQSHTKELSASSSYIIKLFERVVRKAVVKHLEENGFMASGQHGFRALRSILTQPLANWDSIMDRVVERISLCRRNLLRLCKSV